MPTLDLLAGLLWFCAYSTEDTLFCHSSQESSWTLQCSLVQNTGPHGSKLYQGPAEVDLGAAASCQSLRFGTDRSTRYTRTTDSNSSD